MQNAMQETFERLLYVGTSIVEEKVYVDQDPFGFPQVRSPGMLLKIFHKRRLPRSRFTSYPICSGFAVQPMGEIQTCVFKDPIECTSSCIFYLIESMPKQTLNEI
jgi:hypothetical protein